MRKFCVGHLQIIFPQNITVLSVKLAYLHQTVTFQTTVLAILWLNVDPSLAPHCHLLSCVDNIVVDFFQHVRLKMTSSLDTDCQNENGGNHTKPAVSDSRMRSASMVNSF